MGQLVIDNHVIKQDIKSILTTLKEELNNGKLKTIKYSSTGVEITCPHHKNGLENKASCNIFTGNDPNIYWGTCHCFSCDFKGSLAKFIGECFNKDEEYGKEWLKEHFTEKIVENEIDSLFGDPLISTKSGGTKPIKYLSESVLDEFQPWHPYMAERKLTSEICSAFQIKYDKKTQCLIFPVRDIVGNLLFLTRRSVNKKRFLIDKEVEKPLYLLNEVVKRNYNYLILTESQIDALTCWVYGYPAVATMGNPSEEQISILNNTNILTVITMFDNDLMGETFTKKVNRLISKNKFVSNIEWDTTKKDINELNEEEFDSIMQKNNLTMLKKSDII